MDNTVAKLAQLFTFFVILGLTTALISQNTDDVIIPEEAANETAALHALWDDTIIHGTTVNFQIGTAILAVILFITIFSSIIYTQEVNKDEH
ncbi:MAG: hypothetical protein INQ03_06380 [Candidatus Heimdallarchaeota archaeon]|nr:hypothetical protein [Candidatus Heimdallarchaeota archaeon]